MNDRVRIVGEFGVFPAVARCAVPVAVVMATRPAAVVHLIAPPSYDAVSRILLWTAVSGDAVA